MCALAAQHAVEGAVFTDDVSKTPGTADLADELLLEAQELLPQKPEQPDIELARSYGFLALTGTQLRNGTITQMYLGLYHGLAAALSLHDECRWPPTLTDCGREVWRRIWWAMYRLEVHTSCVLGSIIRSPEARCSVGYPVGLHHPAFVSGRDGDFEDWFSGWNVNTDLYRVLEHAISEFRTRDQPRTSILGNERCRSTSTEVMTTLTAIQERLMPQFQAAHSHSADSGRNRCGFQAANILYTIFLSRVVSSAASQTNLSTICGTISEMLQNLNNIPVEYVRATGSLIIQQLAGVGHMLVGVAGNRPLDGDERLRFLEVVNDLLHFLESLQGTNAAVILSKVRLVEHLQAWKATQPATSGTSPKRRLYNDDNTNTEPLDWTAYLDDLFMGAEDEGDVFTRNLLDDFVFSHL